MHSVTRRIAPYFVLFASTLAAACGGAPGAAEPAELRPARPAPAPAFAGTWALAGKSQETRAESAMVVSGHPLASEVGVAVLKRGGNAVDAAVAIGFAMAVVLPEAGNIGGGGFMVIRESNGQASALDYRETAPGRATRDMYADTTGGRRQASTVGHLAAGVPGAVAGMWEAHRRYGRLPWRDLVEPAIRLARDGHVVDSIRNNIYSSYLDRLRRFPASQQQFLINDAAPPVGTVWRQPDLAKTLELIAAQGPDGFYRGPVAELIEQEMARGGGFITRRDLARYRAKWRSPIQARYRGYTILSMPPSSSGGVTMGEIFNILEGYSPMPRAGSARSLHLEAEAMRRAFADRNRHLGDPDFVRNPIERLLSKSYAATLRQGINPSRATRTADLNVAGRDGGETISFAVVDAAGMAVSGTTTINDLFGNAVTVTGAGFLLNNEMDDFTTRPGQPNIFGLVQGEANAIEPGKRMLSSMTPSIVLDPEHRPFLLAGGRGGSRIISGVYHVIANVIDHDMSLGDAVAAPRTHHQSLPDTVMVERGGFTEAALDSLRAMGHGIRFERYLAQVNAILRTPRGWVGVGDPRGGSAARGY
jgi:gamma-glutamyltranspeptidase / glutathione hydrolase